MVSSAKKERLLVVDDAPQTLEVLQRNLTSKGYQVFTAASVAEAIRILETTAVDLVITDLKMPKISGIDLIRHVRENLKDTEVMMITGYPTIEGAVKAIKTGAEEYLTKPFTDEELFSAVRRTLDKLHMRRAGEARLHQTPSAPYGLIGQSETMREVFSAIAKTASTSATLLISGESGTGKELVARAVHYSSSTPEPPNPVPASSKPLTVVRSLLMKSAIRVYPCRQNFSGYSKIKKSIWLEPPVHEKWT